MSESNPTPSEQTQNRTENRTKNRTPWHRFLGKGLELSVGREGVTVNSEVQVSSEPPRIDIVLLRRETPTWTDAQRAMLPDGVRETMASNVLLEFKYTESLTQDAILQASAYEYFYRTGQSLGAEQVQIFILCAKTPRSARLQEFQYEETKLPGVYRSANRYVAHITILVLNQLRPVPWNALVKAFASRPQEKNKAFSLLQQSWPLPGELRLMLDGLQTVWSITETIKMSEALTLERVMEIGEESKRMLVGNLSVEQLDAYINPAYKQRVHDEALEQGLKQGIEQGTTAARKIIEHLLQNRWGDLPPAIQARLRRCTLDQLNTLVDPALASATWDEFATFLPELPES